MRKDSAADGAGWCAAPAGCTQVGAGCGSGAWWGPAGPAHRDPVCLGSCQVEFVLGVRGQQLGEEHGLERADGVAERPQVLKLKVLQQRLDMDSRTSRGTVQRARASVLNPTSSIDCPGALEGRHSQYIAGKTTIVPPLVSSSMSRKHRGNEVDT